MIRTIALMIWMPGFFFVSPVFIPVLAFIGIFSPTIQQKLFFNIAKLWAKQFIGVTGNKTEVIYKDETAKEILAKETVVIVSNHQSNLDIPLILGNLPGLYGFVAKKEMKTWPIIGFWMRRLNCVFLDRKSPRGAVTTMNEAAQNIRNGNSVVIFPEGTRSETGEIGEFKKGSFKLATEPKVKIVPITIIGTREIWKKGTRRVRKLEGRNIRLIVDLPIDVNSLDKTEIKELVEDVKQIIVKNYEEYISF